MGKQLHVLQMYGIPYGMTFLDTLGQAHKVCRYWDHDEEADVSDEGDDEEIGVG